MNLGLDLRTILLILLGVAVAVGIVLLVRRQLYVKSLRDQGFTFTGSPTLAETYGLNCPPFGVGYNRRIDDMVSGNTAAGFPFRVFEYLHLGYVAVLPLPVPLPELFVGPAVRNGAVGLQQAAGPWVVTAKDPAWASAAVAAIGPALDRMAAAGHPVDVSIDGAAIVALGVPREAAGMRAFVEALADVAQAASRADLQRFATAAPPTELGLYARPGWIYRPSDDSFLTQVVLNPNGFGHTTENVVLAEVHGLRMIGLTHHWKTNRTVTETDSEGRTRTRTETDHHTEQALEFHLPWHFGDLSVNWSAWGDKVRFESSDFNDAFTVRSKYPKFASDVFHPRQLEFLLAARPRPFAIEQGRVRFDLNRNDPEVIGHCADFVVRFFAGVPDFVWDDLGHAEPPISPELAGF